MVVATHQAGIARGSTFLMVGGTLTIGGVLAGHPFPAHRVGPRDAGLTIPRSPRQDRGPDCRAVAPRHARRPELHHRQRRPPRRGRSRCVPRHPEGGGRRRVAPPRGWGAVLKKPGADEKPPGVCRGLHNPGTPLVTSAGGSLPADQGHPQDSNSSASSAIYTMAAGLLYMRQI
jgi:hypothetical protein